MSKGLQTATALALADTARMMSKLVRWYKRQAVQKRSSSIGSAGDEVAAGRHGAAGVPGRETMPRAFIIRACSKSRKSQKRAT